jgi:predicted membrane-bound spermidine synthase
MTEILKNEKFANSLLVIAFIEGCSVLSVELLGGKIISSFYGSSLFVWTSVIGITLLGLTVGYFLGGIFSSKKNTENILFHALMLASVFICLMPATGPKILEATKSWGVLSGTVLSAVVLIIPPLTVLGSITPIIIQHLNQNRVGIAGKVAGRIYALTTIGGIAASLLLGFWIIPHFGITYPLLSLAAIIGYYTLIIFIKKSGYKKALPYFFILTIGFITVLSKDNIQSFKGFDKLYETEGLLGQLKVIDAKSPKEGYSSRRLLINGIPQTYIMKNVLKNSLWGYPHMISSISSRKGPNSKAAVFGVGGGSVVKELSDLGFNIDAVDIDKRMFYLAKNYFYLNSSQSIFFIDDARHFIRVCKKQYDVIVIDLLNGEVQPSYVFSIENFLDLRKNLNPDGLLIINFQSNSKGIAAASIYKTLMRAGYFTYYSVNGEEGDDVSDIIFTASLKQQDFSVNKFQRVNECCKNIVHRFLKNPIRNELVDTSKAYLLVDDKPMLDQLNRKSILEYRLHQTRAFLKEEIEAGNKTFN